METAIVTSEGDTQTVRLPKGFYLPTPEVSIRHDGEAIVLEPLKPKTWPAVFFESIRIDDPSFSRPEQGVMPPVKKL